MLPLVWIALSSCQNGGSVSVPDAPLTLTLTSPTYAAFVGDSARVTGRVGPPGAVVTVENREVIVGTDGTFDVEVPMVGPYRNVDVRAFFREQTPLRQRVPVFAGDDPVTSWPGGLGVRVTPRLLAGLGEDLAVQVDASGWEASLLEAMPTVDDPGFRLIPSAVGHRPTEVTLIPGPDGLDLELQIRDLTIDFDAGFQLGDTWIDSPTAIGFATLALRARVTLGTAPDGALTLGITGGDVEVSGAEIQLGAFEGDALEPALQGIGDLIAGLGDAALQALGDGLGTVPLEEPGAVELDLLGTPLLVEIAGIGTDPDGLWVELGLGLDGPIPDPLVVVRPDIDAGGPNADLVIAVHEGLFAPLAQSELLDLVSQDLELGGLFGAGIGLVFTGLPGGDGAPDADAWCLTVAPGDARAVRLGGQPGALATLYLPDLAVDVGITHDGIDCDPWLSASLALEAAFVNQGSELTIDLGAPDGAVLFYATDEDWEEAEVIAGLGGLFGLLTNLAGGSLSFDLGELLGGVDGAGLRLVEVRPVDGHPGVHALGLGVR